MKSLKFKRTKNMRQNNNQFANCGEVSNANDHMIPSAECIHYHGFIVHYFLFAFTFPHSMWGKVLHLGWKKNFSTNFAAMCRKVSQAYAGPFIFLLFVLSSHMLQMVWYIRRLLCLSHTARLLFILFALSCIPNPSLMRIYRVSFIYLHLYVHPILIQFECYFYAWWTIF